MGTSSKNEIRINVLTIPPLPVNSETYTSFLIHKLPLDTSILGTTHSHPNGVLSPSLEDLNNYFVKVMLTIGFPYKSENVKGNRVTYIVVKI